MSTTNNYLLSVASEKSVGTIDELSNAPSGIPYVDEMSTQGGSSLTQDDLSRDPVMIKKVNHFKSVKNLPHISLLRTNQQVKNWPMFQ